jgi:hypothetical protein
MSSFPKFPIFITTYLNRKLCFTNTREVVYEVLMVFSRTVNITAFMLCLGIYRNVASNEGWHIIFLFEGFLIGSYETLQESYLLECDARHSGRLCRHFGQTCCLHPEGRRINQARNKQEGWLILRSTVTGLQSVSLSSRGSISSKNWIFSPKHRDQLLVLPSLLCNVI